MRDRLKEATLYGIVDLGYVQPSEVSAVTKSLVEGGADIIQLRAKGHGEALITELASEILPICKSGGVPFIVNDFPEIAAKVGSDGVHIGQDDGSLAEVRKIVGEQMIVGRSTHSEDQAHEALAEGFDYIGFGPLFPTPTKKGRPGIGKDKIGGVQQSVGQKIPVFCIGGIKRNNIDEVIQAGAQRIVIVSDLLLSDSIEEATQTVKQILLNSKTL